MLRRKLLVACTFIVAAVGIAIASIPFTGSMHPSERAKSARSQHDVSSLGNGDFVFENLNKKDLWDAKILIIRDWRGEVFSHLIPMKEDKVILPDYFWGFGYFYCSEFGPETVVSKIVPAGKIKCHDKDLPEWGKELWQWSYSGEPNSEWMVKMYSPGFELRDNVLYVNR